MKLKTFLIKLGAPRSRVCVRGMKKTAKPTIVFASPTSEQRKQTRCLLHLLLCATLISPITVAAEKTTQVALASALQGTAAISVVLDVSTGRVLAATEATTRSTTPGSILKPFFLASALEQQTVQPRTTVFCRRNLRIRADGKDWDLACTHPQSNVAFAASEALAYSCNTWFAELANRITPQQALQLLAHYGFTPAHPPQTREQKQLLVLGLAGLAVSPMEVALAYRKLALELDNPVLDPVRQGLRNSVTYGMAHAAFTPGMQIEGKTGTAPDAGQPITHGWFAGLSTLGHRAVVIVIYLPHGSGADAARLAQRFFLQTGPS